MGRGRLQFLQDDYDLCEDYDSWIDYDSWERAGNPGWSWEEVGQFGGILNRGKELVILDGHGKRQVVGKIMTRSWVDYDLCERAGNPGWSWEEVGQFGGILNRGKELVILAGSGKRQDSLVELYGKIKSAI